MTFDITTDCGHMTQAYDPSPTSTTERFYTYIAPIQVDIRGARKSCRYTCINMVGRTAVYLAYSEIEIETERLRDLRTLPVATQAFDQSILSTSTPSIHSRGNTLLCSARTHYSFASAHPRASSSILICVPSNPS
jgi:hypothetical protein